MAILKLENKTKQLPFSWKIQPLIDFHNHILPAIDDGAANVEEATSSLAAMCAAGVRSLVNTPHVRGSKTERQDLLEGELEKIDSAFETLRRIATEGYPQLELFRGAELMLDSPNIDLSDPRLRLSGTAFILVEFPELQIPAYASEMLYSLKLSGWKPIIAHPERYRNLNLEIAEEWRTIGCYHQVNHGSIVGRYGQVEERASWELLEQGWVDYLASDYHGRGKLRIADSREAFDRAGGDAQFVKLTENNPSRILSGEDPESVEPLRRRRPLWKKIFGGR